MIEYNITGYKISKDLTLTIAFNETNISFSKALYLAKLWHPMCEKIEIIETTWAIKIDCKEE